MWAGPWLLNPLFMDRLCFKIFRVVYEIYLSRRLKYIVSIDQRARLDLMAIRASDVWVIKGNPDLSCRKNSSAFSNLQSYRVLTTFLKARCATTKRNLLEL